jgi:hypothetical protein
LVDPVCSGICVRMEAKLLFVVAVDEWAVNSTSSLPTSRTLAIYSEDLAILSARPNVIASVQVGGPSTLLLAHVENLAQQSAQFRQLLCNLGRSGCNPYSMDVRDLLEVELLGLNVDCVGGLGDQIRAQSLIQVVEGKGGENS